MVSQGRRAQWRPCRLEAAPLREVAAWAEQYRRCWDERFVQLDDYLKGVNTTWGMAHGSLS